ncbi:hypothetical protein HXX76_004039 [Chlamydomonas incerta]|uniref:Uncharacterized protein n=1 Tax=Chlamydomonas incerta TaxID=51695 RepID=A0A835TJF4_CHLIN|nr:hypothetical protein HXX76_004039 [Chlamydomonas incerta]|eukprot:KAG2439920.1 hypothetical protein HXX76_004039 [Chlamydomonas incerta]
MQASARTRGANASALAACDTKLLLLLDLGAGGLGGEASRPPRLQQIGSSRRATGGRSSSVLDTSQLGSWFVVHWWPDKEGDEVAGVGGTSGSGSCGRPQLESLHAFAARFLPQSALGRAAAEDTAKAEQAVLELISVLPYPESSGVKGLEELRGALTSGRVQERELQPLAQWWQGGPGPCSALGAAHAAATEHQHNYHEQHAQALRGSDAQQDPESSGAFAALLLLAEAAVEPNLAKGVAQEQSMSAQAATMGKEWGVQEPTRRAQGAALDTTDGSQEGGGRDVATAQHQHAEPSSQTASPQLV